MDYCCVRKAWSVCILPVRLLISTLTSYLPKHRLLPPVQPGHHDLHRVNSLRPPGLQELLAGRQPSKDNRLWEPLAPLSSYVVMTLAVDLEVAFPVLFTFSQPLWRAVSNCQFAWPLFVFQVRASAAPWSDTETLAHRMGCLPCAIDVHPHSWAINAGSGSRDL